MDLVICVACIELGCAAVLLVACGLLAWHTRQTLPTRSMQ